MGEKSLSKLEGRLWRQIRLRGSANHVEVQGLLRKAVLLANKLAMSLLAEGEVEESLRLLNKAQWLAKPDNGSSSDDVVGIGMDAENAALRVLTWNNLACWHRKRGDADAALQCLRAAAKVGIQASGDVGPQHLAVTHSNLGAILSQRGQHRRAIEHTKLAVYFSERVLLASLPPGAALTFVPEAGSADDVLSVDEIVEKRAALAIACHNYAVELEFCDDESCLKWYKKAVQLARRMRGGHLLRTFQGSYNDARTSWQKREQKRRQREREEEQRLLAEQQRYQEEGGEEEEDRLQNGGSVPEHFGMMLSRDVDRAQQQLAWESDRSYHNSTADVLDNAKGATTLVDTVDQQPRPHSALDHIDGGAPLFYRRSFDHRDGENHQQRGVSDGGPNGISVAQSPRPPTAEHVAPALDHRYREDRMPPMEVVVSIDPQYNWEETAAEPDTGASAVYQTTWPGAHNSNTAAARDDGGSAATLDDFVRSTTPSPAAAPPRRPATAGTRKRGKNAMSSPPTRHQRKLRRSPIDGSDHLHHKHTRASRKRIAEAEERKQRRQSPRRDGQKRGTTRPAPPRWANRRAQTSQQHRRHVPRGAAENGKTTSTWRGAKIVRPSAVVKRRGREEQHRWPPSVSTVDSWSTATTDDDDTGIAVMQSPASASSAVSDGVDGSANNGFRGTKERAKGGGKGHPSQLIGRLESQVNELRARLQGQAEMQSRREERLFNIAASLTQQESPAREDMETRLQRQEQAIGQASAAIGMLHQYICQEQEGTTKVGSMAAADDAETNAAAVVKLQAAGRGFIRRQSLAADMQAARRKHEENNAAVLLQAGFRGYAGRRQSAALMADAKQQHREAESNGFANNVEQQVKVVQLEAKLQQLELSRRIQELEATLRMKELEAELAAAQQQVVAAHQQEETATFESELLQQAADTDPTRPAAGLEMEGEDTNARARRNSVTEWSPDDIEDTRRMEAALVAAFQSADVGGKGWLAPQEVKRMLKTLDLGLTSTQLELVVAEGDSNGDGVVDYREFVPMMLTLLQSFKAQLEAASWSDELETRAEEEAWSAREALNADVKPLSDAVLHECVRQGRGKRIASKKLVSVLTEPRIGLSRSEASAVLGALPSPDEQGRVLYGDIEAALVAVRMLAFKAAFIEINTSSLESHLIEVFEEYATTPRQDCSRHIAAGLIPPSELQMALLNVPRLMLSRVQVMLLISQAEMLVADGDGGEPLVDLRKFARMAACTIEAMFDVPSLRQRSELQRRADVTPVALLNGLERDALEDQLLKIFIASDTNDDGVLDIDEFKNCLNASELGLGDGEIAALMVHADRDANGVVDYHEFLEFCYDALVDIAREKAILALPRETEAPSPTTNRSLVRAKSLDDIDYERRPSFVRDGDDVLISERRAVFDADGLEFEAQSVAQASRRARLASMDDPQADAEMQKTTDSDIVAEERALLELFKAHDGEARGYVSAEEFHLLFTNAGLGLSPQQVTLVMAEADENDDGVIDYHAFVPIATELMIAFRAHAGAEREQKEREAWIEDQAIRKALSGEVTLIVEHLMRKLAAADPGCARVLPRATFRAIAKRSKNGLTRNEVNALMAHMPTDSFGNIRYGCLSDVLFEIRVSSIRNTIINTTASALEKYLAKLCEEMERRKHSHHDRNMGYLTRPQLQTVLMTAPHLPLARMAVLSIMSEAREDEFGLVDYRRHFVPVAAKTIERLFDFRSLQRRAELLSHAGLTPAQLLGGLDREQVEARLRDTFRMHDAANFGVLSAADFCRCMRSFEVDLSESDIRTLLYAADVKDDGNVDYGEFLDIAYQLLLYVLRERALDKIDAASVRSVDEQVRLDVERGEWLEGGRRRGGGEEGAYDDGAARPQSHRGPGMLEEQPIFGQQRPLSHTEDEEDLREGKAMPPFSEDDGSESDGVVLDIESESASEDGTDREPAPLQHRESEFGIPVAPAPLNEFQGSFAGEAAVAERTCSPPPPPLLQVTSVLPPAAEPEGSITLSEQELMDSNMTKDQRMRRDRLSLAGLSLDNAGGENDALGIFNTAALSASSHHSEGVFHLNSSEASEASPVVDNAWGRGKSIASELFVLSVDRASTTSGESDLLVEEEEEDHHSAVVGGGGQSIASELFVLSVDRASSSSTSSSPSTIT